LAPLIATMQRICLVVPCYNESNRLHEEAIISALNNYPDLSICFVNDGSKDNTAEVLINLRDNLSENNKSRCWVSSYQTNRGKSGAIQHGLRCMTKNPMLANQFQYITNSADLNKNQDFIYGDLNIPQFDYFGYWDADLATPFSELDWFFHHAKTENYVLIMGSRVARLGAEIHRTIFRHYSGRLFATIISQGLGWKVHDTQCGAKIFNRQVLDIVVSEPFITQWLFDVEILLRLKQSLGNDIKQKIIEVPLRNWEDVKGSKLGLKDFIRVPFQIWKVFSRY
jgi:dolichyl-phosphate beta-glucosyltransferase